MDSFRRNIKSFSDESRFHFGNRGHYRSWTYINKKVEKRCELFDIIDSDSDASFDTSSDRSWYVQQPSPKSYIHAGMKTLSGSDNVGSLRLPSLYESSLYSDEEMSDFPLDETVLRRTIKDEQKKLQSFRALAYRDMKAWDHNVDFHHEYGQDAIESLYIEANFLPNASSMSDDDWFNLEEVQDKNEISKRNLYETMYLSGAHFYPRPEFLKHNDKERHRKPTRMWDSSKAPMDKKPSNIPEPSKNGPYEDASRSSAINCEQRIFLGGLPVGITERSLRQELAAQGYKVLRRPKILGTFSPEVWMRSAKEAKELVEKGVITIKGVKVEVRPFNSMMQQISLRKLPDVANRSVFLGGLSRKTTTKDIFEALLKLNMKVVNYPLVKFGYSRQVVLGKSSQARTLINMKNLFINGKFVEVRPYLSHRKPSSKS